MLWIIKSLNMHSNEYNNAYLGFDKILNCVTNAPVTSISKTVKL